MLSVKSISSIRAAIYAQLVAIKTSLLIHGAKTAHEKCLRIGKMRALWSKTVASDFIFMSLYKFSMQSIKQAFKMKNPPPKINSICNPQTLNKPLL